MVRGEISTLLASGAALVGAVSLMWPLVRRESISWASSGDVVMMWALVPVAWSWSGGGP